VLIIGERTNANGSKAFRGLAEVSRHRKGQTRDGACTNLDDRAKMMELLEPGRIGVELSEAKHFNV
jgi:cobalamin-dependent methionine synthase I